MAATTDQLQRRVLGRTGLLVSPLGFGAAPIGLLGTDQPRVATILNQLLDDGINLIDTAAGYAGAEAAIGQAVSHRRDEYILISKCGRGSEDLPGPAWSAPLIRATVDRSLKRLRTDRLDVMLLHSCDLETLKKAEALDALAGARDAGKIRFAGYSGDNEAVVFAAAHPAVSVVETSINMVDQANIDALLPVARKHNVGVMTKRSVANAAWRSPRTQQGFYQEYSREYHQRFQAMRLRLEDLGLGPEVTDWVEVALRFALSQPGVATALIGTTNPENSRHNVQAAAKGPLPDKVIQQIRNAFERTRQAAGQPWPALT
jgi:aryl-alcohol dehydrogenase-like predicted oxidoreductase